MGDLHEMPDRDGARKDAASIRREVDKIVASDLFAKADRLCQFLRFIVETSLESGSEAIKETLVGVHVYGRPIGYDPKIDPIVRNQARRLRVKLTEYFNGPGLNDRVVITVPTGGYAPQFEVHPEAILEPALIVLPAAAPTRPQFPAWWRFAWIAAALALSVGVGSLLNGWARRSAPAAPPHAFPVTRYQGFEFQPSLSRDGKRVAFVWNGRKNNYNIYQQSLELGEPVRLTADRAYDLNPSWSPDSREIAFLRLFPDGGKEILIVPADGGKARLLCHIHALNPFWVQEASISNELPGPAWSPDGHFLAVSDHTREHTPDTLFLLSVQSGDEKQVTFPAPGGQGDYYPAWSPDGRRLAFVREFNQGYSSDIYVQPLSGGEPRRITFDSKIISGLTWVSENRLVFSSNRLGDAQLWTVPADGGTPEVVAGAGAAVSQPTATGRSRTLVYTEHFRNTNVWRVGIGDGSRSPANEVIASSSENDSAEISPDGRKIVFASDRSGVVDLWICEADGSHPVKLVSGKGAPIGTPRWSPDGRQVVFDTVRNRRSVIEVIDEHGGSPRVLVSRSSDAMMPAWSRDGRFVYFVSVDGTAPTQVWKQPVNGGPATQITRQSGGEAREAPNGQSLYYLRTGRGIWQTGTWGGTEMPVPGLEHVDTSRYFAMGEKGIYFLASENPPWTIHFYDFATRRIAELVTIPHAPSFRTPSLSVSPDGDWLLYSEVDEAGEDLMGLRNMHY